MHNWHEQYIMTSTEFEASVQTVRSKLQARASVCSCDVMGYYLPWAAAELIQLIVRNTRVNDVLVILGCLPL